VQSIKAVLIEPVGCLAEFTREPFDQAGAELFGLPAEPGATGSQAYWRLIRHMEHRAVSPEVLSRLTAFELRAANEAELYDDVRSSLAALAPIGIGVILTSSLSRAAVTRFVERHALSNLFAGAVTRDEAGGVGAHALRTATEQAAVAPAQIIALADTADALELIKQQGLNAMLMINDYDEGRALAERNPAGGIVSLAELPDALRLIEQRYGLRAMARAPRAPFELFDPS
jgi:beta-phosphoglucomutase-like phosphatase (HAD superfamily)